MKKEEHDLDLLADEKSKADPARASQDKKEIADGDKLPEHIHFLPQEKYDKNKIFGSINYFHHHP